MNLSPLRDLVAELSRCVNTSASEPELMDRASEALARLLAQDDWLPTPYAQPRQDRYAQYLLYADPLDRFSVVSFVWQNGQATPVHNHTVWGLVGQYRGRELCRECSVGEGGVRLNGHQHTMKRGDIDRVSPSLGDWHQVAHASGDEVAVSIHIYGANIGRVRRQRLDDLGAVIDFVSGYDLDHVPNLWA